MADQEPTPNSRNIPAPIEREVRQRCGFGCVICGFPLYDYDHILGWANVKRHVADEITLLCNQHHGEKHRGLLPNEEVIEANKNPFNFRTGATTPYDLRYSGNECEALIGGNRFTTQDQGYGTKMVPISVDDTPLLGFVLTDGHLLLNLAIFDEYNSLVLHIKNNQLRFSTNPWDVQLVGRNLVIREASRKILVDIRFEVPNRIVIDRGRFLRNGVEVLIRPNHLVITNNAMIFSDNAANNVPYGLLIGPHTNQIGGCCIGITTVPRYLGDNTETLRWIRETFGGDVG